jgi:tungstate transport system substrate-binding protein
MKNLKVCFICTTLFLAALLAACGPAANTPANPNLILATTTSTQDSGLLDVLIPAFEARTSFVVQTVAGGSGAALKMGEEGNADVLFVHSPAAEVTFMDNGFGSDRRLVMHNYFVLVGPASDPAGVRGLSPVAALTAIFNTGSPFVSRADGSGTNIMEVSLWKSTGLDPAGKSWYAESGQGMGATLTIASETGAYTLTDRATYLANKNSLALEILVDADPSLLNVYHVIIVNPERWPAMNLAGATAFADFVTSAEGQALIGQYGLDTYGQALFIPDAGKDESQLGQP